MGLVVLLSAGHARAPRARRRREPHASHAGGQRGSPLAAERRRRLPLHDLRCSWSSADAALPRSSSGSRSATCSCSSAPEPEGARCALSRSSPSSRWSPQRLIAPARPRHPRQPSTEPEPRSRLPARRRRRSRTRRSRTVAKAPEFKWLPVFLATAAGSSCSASSACGRCGASAAALAETHPSSRSSRSSLEDTLADLYAETDPRQRDHRGVCPRRADLRGATACPRPVARRRSSTSSASSPSCARAAPRSAA